MNPLKSQLQSVAVVFLMGLSISYTVQAKGGGMDSGGGNSVVCRNADGTIRSAEFFDLFEGRALYNMPLHANIKRDKRSYLELAVAMSERIGFGGFEKELQALDSDKHIMPSDTGVNIIDDSLSPIVPKGCAVVQTAAYMPSGKLYVDGEIWNALSKVGKAALLLHEVFYAFMRDEGETNSVRTRRVVAAAFAGKKFESVYDGIDQKKDHMVCLGKNEVMKGSWSQRFKYLIVIYPIASTDGRPRVRIQFVFANGVRMLSKTYQDETVWIGDAKPLHPEIDNLKTGFLETWLNKRNGGSEVHSVVDFDQKIFVGFKNFRLRETDSTYAIAGPYKGSRPYPGGGDSDGPNPDDFHHLDCKIEYAKTENP